VSADVPNRFSLDETMVILYGPEDAARLMAQAEAKRAQLLADVALYQKHYEAVVSVHAREIMDGDIGSARRYLLCQTNRDGDCYYGFFDDRAGLERYAADEYDDWPEIEAWDLADGKRLRVFVAVTVHVADPDAV
jgi:hypothetical protein